MSDLKVNVQHENYYVDDSRYTSIPKYILETDEGKIGLTPNAINILMAELERYKIESKIKTLRGEQ